MIHTRIITPIDDLKREARAQGIPWKTVQSAYGAVREREWEKRDRAREVRQAAWWLHTASTPGSWPFWRHGFTSRWGRRVDRSDFTVIRGYDEIAQEIAGQFPEWGGDDGTERLWAFLLSSYDRMPDRETMLEEALEWVVSVQGEEIHHEGTKSTKSTKTTQIPF
jgi:hypothetical protein